MSTIYVFHSRYDTECDGGDDCVVKAFRDKDRAEFFEARAQNALNNYNEVCKIESDSLEVIRRRLMTKGKPFNYLSLPEWKDATTQHFAARADALLELTPFIGDIIHHEYMEFYIQEVELDERTL